MSLNFNKLMSQFKGTATFSENEQNTLRERLVDEGRIRPLPPVPEGELVAIDGARLVDQRYGYDLAAARGCAANARNNPQVPEPEAVFEAHILPHSSSSGRTSGTMMAAMELYMLDACTHKYRILDGSLIVPLIGLREGLYASEPSARIAAEEAYDTYNARENLAALYSLEPLDSSDPHGAHHVITVTKSDISMGYGEAWRAEGLLDTSQRDRVLATFLLEPGEYLTPIPMRYADIHVGRQSSREPSAYAHAVDEAARQLMTLSRDNYVQMLYMKPRASRTVLRIEYAALERDAVAGEYAAIVESDTVAPHLLEPFSQWRVDKLAKELSAQPDIIVQGLLTMMNNEEKAYYGEMLTTRYRT
jgi:hypothetical protein